MICLLTRNPNHQLLAFYYSFRMSFPQLAFIDLQCVVIWKLPPVFSSTTVCYFCFFVCQVFPAFGDSEAQRRSVQVARLHSPAGLSALSLPLLHRCLLAHISCHMFPAQPVPEGAKSVFAHNLHSLTRPWLPLTGKHGRAFMERSGGFTLLPEL